MRALCHRWTNEALLWSQPSAGFSQYPHFRLNFAYYHRTSKRGNEYILATAVVASIEWF